MRSDCWLQSQVVQREIQDYFAGVDRDLSEYYEWNPHMREDHLDGRLIGIFGERSLKLTQRRVNQERQRKRQPALKLEITARHVTDKEHRHGADFGLVARISTPEFRMVKAALVQSKRLEPRGERFDARCRYSELFATRPTLPSQWVRLERATSAGVYFLYNPYQITLGRTPKTLGTKVMGANTVRGIAGSDNPVLTAQRAHEEGRSFAEWMVDSFLCCETGDTRPEVIDAALGERRDFPVRGSIVISIAVDEAQTDLFAQ